jgi:histidyl-tRNA synthetase
VLAGGRYDGLIGDLGGPETPGVGWAAGIERLAMLIEEPGPEPAELVIVPDEERVGATATRILAILRQEGIRAEMAFSGSAKKRYDRAKRGDALRVLNVSLDEEGDGFAIVRIRDLRESAPYIRKRLREALSRHFSVRELETREFVLSVLPS